MSTSRAIAITVGVLYIIGTVAGVLSVVVTKSTLDAPDYLVRVSTNPNQITTGALLGLIMGLALAMVPVVVFPILRKHSETLAVGYVVVRGGLETATYIAQAIAWLVMVRLSQAYAAAGAAQASNFQALGALLVAGHDSTGSVLEIVFPLGALMLYSAFYRSHLIPRWLSGWGFLAAIVWLAMGFLVMFRLIIPWSMIQVALSLPIGVQEMVMAVWLIVKGFNRSAIADLEEKFR